MPYRRKVDGFVRMSLEGKYKRKDKHHEKKH